MIEQTKTLTAHDRGKTNISIPLTAYGKGGQAKHKHTFTFQGKKNTKHILTAQGKGQTKHKQTLTTQCRVQTKDKLILTAQARWKNSKALFLSYSLNLFYRLFWSHVLKQQPEQTWEIVTILFRFCSFEVFDPPVCTTLGTALLLHRWSSSLFRNLQDNNCLAFYNHIL